MLKSNFVFAVLILSLTCFAQTSTPVGASNNSGTTVVQESPSYAPTVVPSDVTLPGSGPPVGAPIGNENSNDARVGGTVEVYNPAMVIEHPVEGAATSSNVNVSAPTPVNVGMQNFAGEIPSQDKGTMSLGEVARQFRAKAHTTAKVFTNEAVQQGYSSQEATETTPQPQRDVQHEMAMPAALPPVTSESVESGMPENDQGTTAGSSAVDQQRRSRSHAASSSAQSAANSSEASNQPSQEESNTPSDRLPASGSNLPLFGLIGLLGMGGGTVYLLRR